MQSGAMLHALELAEGLASGALSRAALAELIARRIDAVEPTLRAFAHFDGDQFRSDMAAAGGGPLQGVPVAFKDIIDTARYPTRYGSPIYDGWRPRADATIVCMTEAAGGVLQGKAVTTEFAFLQPAETINPRAPQLTPGGSSSGSAAGVAAGVMALAFGTQTGGSVIRPAAFCGVTAMKPSFGLLPTVGVKTTSWSLDTLGLFAARVEDVAFALEAVTARPLRVDGSQPGAPRIGVSRLEFAGTATRAAHAGLERAIAALERAGAQVHDVDVPTEFVAAHQMHPVIYNYEGGLALAHEIARHRAALSPILLEHFALDVPLPVEVYDEARGVSKRARDQAKLFFRGFDALLTFAAPSPIPDRSSTGSACFNRLFTLLGTPCVAVRTGEGAAEEPACLQVIAGFGRDRQALQAAHFIQTALEGVD